jgi:hypothetical protein
MPNGVPSKKRKTQGRPCGSYRSLVLTDACRDLKWRISESVLTSLKRERLWANA